MLSASIKQNKTQIVSDINDSKVYEACGGGWVRILRLKIPMGEIENRNAFK